MGLEAAIRAAIAKEERGTYPHNVGAAGRWHWRAWAAYGMLA
jgi:hypothetical protein